MNKIINKIFSMPNMVIALFAFFVAIGWATFIENDFGTPIAQKWIYKSLWFEILIGYLFIGMIVNIVRYKLLQLKKLGSLTFHIAFLVVLIGAFITRNYGFEGVMQIAEGESSNIIISSDTYIQIRVDDLEQQYTFDEAVIMDTNDRELYDRANIIYRSMASVYANSYYHSFTFPGENEACEIEYLDFIKNAKDTLVVDENGLPYVELVTVGSMGRQYNYLQSGKVLIDGNLVIAFNNDEYEGAISIFETDSGMFVKSPHELGYLQMSDQSEGIIYADSIQEFIPRRLYSMDGTQFVFNKYLPNAKLETISSKISTGGLHGLRMKVSQGKLSEEVVLRGGKGMYPNIVNFTMGNLNYRLAYGSKIVELPFYLYLKDFQMERYPGTNNPSSYASEVTLIDKKAGIEEEYRIFMNNVLDYGGYRFFQSSYDPSETGTILSVNQDAPGTLITYIGYFLLGLGFVINLVSRGSRFRFLINKTREVRIKRESLSILILLFGLTAGNLGFSQHIIDSEHADKFGRLVIQNQKGRLEPVHTLATNILKKISRRDNYEGQSAMQVFLGMHTSSLDSGALNWGMEPIIYVSGSEVRKKLNLDGKYACFYDFIAPDYSYLLNDDVQKAFMKRPALRNTYDKDLIKTDERFNILLGVFNGAYLQIFPKPNDPNHGWCTPFMESLPFEKEDAEFVNAVTTLYMTGVQQGYTTGDWTNANKGIELIDVYQRKTVDAEVLPSYSKIDMEITYNEMDVFKKLTFYYFSIGFILLILVFTQIFALKFNLKWPIRIGFILFIGLFILHGVGLGMRWYLSGHAPWSNGYEVMLFVSFIALFVGIIFNSISKIVLPATGIFAALLLFVAYMNSYDPQITQLVPVLKSYWLMIHVAIITGSYAFLGIGALLSLINLNVLLLSSSNSNKRARLAVKEVTYVIEMLLIIGLFMLTIGTFLGGVWANESWGRYWGWDAKETWALASVLVYAVVLHLRFIPGMKSQLTFNLATLWAYGAIIMTFFGVNFYLSGLHSYATGDPVPFPTWAFVTISVLAILSVAVWIKNRKGKLVSSKKDPGQLEVE